MIQSVTITNNLGESINISMTNPEQSGFFIKSIEGLGPPPATLNFTDSLATDGAFFNSAKLQKRNLTFNIGFYDKAGESVETLRQRTYTYFPIKKQVVVTITTDNRVVSTVGLVEKNEPDIFSKTEDTSISIVCPSSYLTGDTITTLLSGYVDNFQFPWQNNSLVDKMLEMSIVYINDAGNVHYEGDIDTGVVILLNIVGAVNDITLNCITTGQSMVIDSNKLITMTGEDLHYGDLIMISTVKGSKFVYLLRDDTLYNILNAMGPNIGWFTISNGDNVFTYTADSGQSNIQMTLEHRILYGGV